MVLRFGVLGPLEVRSDREVLEIGGARRRALLAYLLVHAGIPQPLDRIVEALDPELHGGVSPTTIQTYVSQLRKRFGTKADSGAGIVHRAGGYLLELNSDALDATCFETAVAAASVEPDPEARRARLVEALELWRGPPLDEFAGRDWADERARHWTRMYVLAQHLRAGALLDAGNHRDARSLLEQLVAGHPLHEPFWEQLIVARYRCGEQGEALAAVREAHAVLARELGVEPGPALVELERRVLAQDPALVAPIESPPLVSRSTGVLTELPRGVVTFLLTDIESSTKSWDDHPTDMAKALARYEDLADEVVGHHGGRLLKWRGEGDSTMSVFARATDACAAAVALQRCLGSEVWPGELTLRTRVAIHTGEAQLRDGDYYGGTLNRAARVRDLANGGETLLSRATHDVVADVLPDDVCLVDVGEHEIRGLRRNEHLFVLTAPGLESGEGRRIAEPQSEPPDEFIGRADDLARVVDALATPGIVTVTGPGGIGKTRLLREVRAAAQRGKRTYERFYNVELAGVRDRVAVEGALQGVLVPEDAATAMTRRPAEAAADAVDELAAAVGTRRSLLAVDNCEHVIDDVADLVEGIVVRCPNVSVLATSREPLGLPNERVISLGPLALPAHLDVSSSRLGEVAAIKLLLQRARDAGSDLRLTPATAGPLIALCRLLDGVPLALELAAARLRSTSPEDLHARLDGQMHVLDTKRGDPRHRSLYGAIDWSYQLLDPSEQLLMRRLGIFVGGFTLAAAEEVCADDHVLAGASAVYVNLAELVSKSLVMFDREHNRYRSLEPVRMFAREQLDAHDETVAVAERHAQWILHASAAALADQVFGTAGTAANIVADLDNVHAALDWLDATSDHLTFLRIVARLGFTWFGSDWRRGRVAAARAAELSSGARPRLRGAVLLSRGIVEQRAALYESSQFFEEAREIFGELDDPMSMAWATFFLGRAYLVRDNATCTKYMAESVDRFRAVQLPLGEAWAEIQLGTIADMAGDIDGAGQHYGRAYDLATQIGNISLKGTVVGELAGIALAQQDLDRARAQLHEAIELQREGGDLYNTAAHLNDLAEVEILAGDIFAARECVVASIRAGIGIDDEWQLSEALLLLAVVLLEEGNPSDARRVMAASGWDVAAPQGLLDFARSILKMTLARLEPLRIAAYEGAAIEGRRMGRLETARAFLATQEP